MFSFVFYNLINKAVSSVRTLFVEALSGGMFSLNESGVLQLQCAIHIDIGDKDHNKNGQARFLLMHLGSFLTA